MRFGMMIELDKCVGCQACVTACKERWDSGPGAARDWVLEYEHGKRGKDLGITFYPGLCNHCDGHPCTTDCPTGATFMNDEGVVVVDPDVCIGCGNCISMCPYGARHADATKGIVEKCNFCAPYVARGDQPACVQTCLAECRHFGDLDDPHSGVSRLIRERQAAPLTTATIDVGPQVYYAPPVARQHVLDADVVKPPKPTELTQLWDSTTRPVARTAVPAIMAASVVGGLVTNVVAWRQKRTHDQPVETEGGDGPDPATEALPEALPRHSLGMRLLHWFNLISWVLLLVTGTALMIAPSFALFGTAGPAVIRDLVGGASNLLLLHVLWGLAWALTIIPGFLKLKHGGLDALREMRPTWDDLRWMMIKPLVMVGRLSPSALPPQDKYNAGQKAFAASALVGTTLIIVTGVMMTFHLGSPEVIRWAILGHKLAIMVALVALPVHITMAAVISDERPALKSMITGKVSKAHASAHSSKWVDAMATKSQEPTVQEATAVAEDEA